MGGTPNNEFILFCLSLYPKIGLAPPSFLIETGTYYGKGATFFSCYFENVHTIELSLKWHTETSSLLSDFKNIQFHHGDSVNILPRLLQPLNHNLAFYLDAHYSGGETSRSEKEVPLLDELKIIQKRKHKDLIIVDDLRLFGKKGMCGHEGHQYYPPMYYDWTTITIESVLKTVSPFAEPYSITLDDRLIIITNLSDKEKLLLQN